MDDTKYKEYINSIYKDKTFNPKAPNNQEQKPTKTEDDFSMESGD